VGARVVAGEGRGVLHIAVLPKRSRRDMRFFDAA
jgi:hypothetical protein